MNSKMTTNSQLSNEPKRKEKQTNQTTRRGTESQKWISHGGLSAGSERRERGRMRGKVEGIRSIIGRYNIDREK